MRVARVFPRKTRATPEDHLSFYDVPGLFIPEADEIHISVTFTADIDRAEKLATAWEWVAPVKVGGPAMGDPGEDFEPGKYVRHGYVITSRGCPNNCWFCDVPKREGNIRELPIMDGHNVLDSNLLACSPIHILEVFEMLRGQPQRAQFTGGLEAARLEDWHVSALWNLRPEQMFFAYDTPDDYEPLVRAGKMLWKADFTRSHCRCYVLIGYPKDTIAEAEKRLFQAWDAGFMPMAMLWQGKNGRVANRWQQFQRRWARPAITRSHVKSRYIYGPGAESEGGE